MRGERIDGAGERAIRRSARARARGAGSDSRERATRVERAPRRDVPGLGGEPRIATSRWPARSCGGGRLSSRRACRMARGGGAAPRASPTRRRARRKERDAVGERRHHPRSWLIRITARSFSRRRRSSRRRIPACTVTSSAVVGSSAISSFGSAGERDRDRDPLAHAAGELVRVGASTRSADRGCAPRSSSSSARRSAAPPDEAEVQPDVLGQLAPDREHRVQRRHRVLEDHREVAPGELAHGARRREGEQIAAVEARRGPSRQRRPAAGGAEHRHRLPAPALPGDAEHPRLDPVVHTVVDGVDYRVEEGEVFGVAGESGSGKTMSMLALLGVLPDGAAVEGHVSFDGRDLLALAAARRRELAGRDLAMVFQDPMTSLHPMLTIGRQLTEHVRLHLGFDRRAAEAVRSSCSRRCASPRRASPARLPARVLRRHAPADRDRDRPRLPPEAADRRRADDGARRHRAGRHPAAARPPPPRERPRGDPDQPRPRGHVGDRRPRLDLLRGACGGVGIAGGRPAPAAPPVHTRTAGRVAASRAAREPAARGDPRLPAEPREHPARLRVPPAVRVRARRLPLHVPELVARNGRALACPVDPFAAE